MPTYEIQGHVSYGIRVHIEAETLEAAQELGYEKLSPEEIWSMSLDQGDAPDANDIDIDWVQEVTK